MNLGTIAAALLVSLVTACASDPGSGPRDDADAPSAGSADVTPGGSDPADARRALRAAVDTMTHDQATGFRSLLLVDGEAFSDTTGVTGATGWESSSDFSAPDDGSPSAMEVRSTDGTVWMQMQGWPPDAAGCWLVMGAGQVPVGMLAMTPDQPVYHRLLAALSASGFADAARTTLVGELRADAALNLLTAQLVAELDLEGLRGSDRVAVEIGYDGSRVTSVSMAGPDVLRVVEAAGGSASDVARATLGVTEVRVEYSLPATAPTFSAPPARLVMTADQMTPAGGGCRSGG